MSNPFRVLIVIAVVIAVVIAAGFVYVVFFQPDPHAKALSETLLALTV